MDLTTIALLAATVGGLYLAWNIGANDVANAMGTALGTGALSVPRAIAVAAIAELAGAMLLGPGVTHTIMGGIVQPSAFAHHPPDLALGMTSCLIAAAGWLQFATYVGWPVSSTHSIVGAILGFGLIGGGADAVQWSTVAQIMLSWVVAPLFGALLAFVLSVFLSQRVLAADRPLAEIRVWGPLLVLPVVSMLAFGIVMEETRARASSHAEGWAALIALGVGSLATLIAVPIFRRLVQRSEELTTRERGQRAERVFLSLQALTAACVAFAHGSNDVGNAVGPLVVVYQTVSLGIQGETTVPTNVLVLGASGLVLGLATYGSRVMRAIGQHASQLTPSRGFTAEFAAAATILLASGWRLPISTTHVLIACVVGVSFTRSLGAVDPRVVRRLLASWLVTMPLTALLSAALFHGARLI